MAQAALMLENCRNLALCFKEAAKNYPGTFLFTEAGGARKELSRAELLGQAESLAAYLSASGIRPGDRVGILSSPRPEWYAAFIAIELLGAVAVPVNESFTGAEIGAAVKDASPALVFVSAETRPLMDPLAGIFKTMDFDSEVFKEIISRVFPGALAPGGLAGALPADYPASAKFCLADPGDPAVILYTSGTTADPKGVVLTHANIIADLNAVIAAGIVREGDNLLSALPLYHAYPLMGALTLPFVMGASVTLCPVKELARFAGEFRATIIVAVPQMLEMMNNGIKGRLPGPVLPVFRACRFLRRLTGINLGRLVFGKVHRALGGKVRLLASGGARLEPDTMLDLEGLGFTVLEGYGLTETSPVAAFNPPGARKPGSVGLPVQSARIMISTEGEVLIKGPMVMKGYWHKPKETAEVIKDGYFYSGDLGYMDKDGYLYLTGRKKEVLVLGSGENVQPARVEAHYMQSPFIKEVAVYEERGSLKALIVPDFEYAKSAGISNLREQIGWELKDLSMKLPSPMRLSGFDLVQGPMPRTSLGKIKRYRLGELVRASGKGPRSPSPELLEGEGKKVLQALRQAAGDPSLAARLEDNLELDLGLDSIKKIELLSALEQYMHASLPDDFLGDVQDVSGLLEKFKNYPAGPAGPPAGPAGPPAGKAETKTLRAPAYAKALRTLFMPIMRILIKILFRAEVSGNVDGEGVPQGGFIIAPNHASYLDGFILAAVVPGGVFSRLYFQGLERFFKWGGPAGIMQVIPIDPERHLAGALSESARVLEAGKILCIFPEGGRSYDGSLMEFKKGIAALALKTGAPVVPAWIEGSFKALPRGRWLIRPVKIKVYFGRPIDTRKFKEGEQFLSALRSEIVRLSEKAKGGPGR